MVVFSLGPVRRGWKVKSLEPGSMYAHAYFGKCDDGWSSLTGCLPLDDEKAAG